ncbi:MAG: [FeFe] hydrogenase H-cluster radical SAM maturase HydE [Hespellia sp.]|nr:[FeFe] hydrogenase H-cluster radical SAM maturase HydE [Hespellia sp.]
MIKETNYELIEKLEHTQSLTKEEFVTLLSTFDDDLRKFAAKKAVAVAKKYYGNKVYVRGLIEFTNYCKNDCYYCGIRCGNQNAQRYRLSREEIMECCASGYELGFRTFVLQGGEDLAYTDEIMVDLIQTIKRKYPDCALTLSMGEKAKETYQKYYDAGADRYLLRHEAADDELYGKLHPAVMSGKVRRQCLRNLKEIGFQTGCGGMVGAPYQTEEHLAADLLFAKELQPEMVGIGPFIPHHDTCFKDETAGTLELTLFLLSLYRLMLPKVLLPATTALGTINPTGREQGILSGANVTMPNLSPGQVRKKYLLYDNKICTGDEAAECRNCLNNRMKSIGYEIVTDRGDYGGGIK